VVLGIFLFPLAPFIISIKEDQQARQFERSQQSDDDVNDGCASM